MNSVLKNEEAIMRYARQPKPGIDSNKGRNTAKILPHLKNPNFWTSLELVISWSLYIKPSIFLRWRIIRCHEFFTIGTRYELIYTPKRKNTLILSV